jgi:hypothetical protein
LAKKDGIVATITGRDPNPNATKKAVNAYGVQQNTYTPETIQTFGIVLNFASKHIYIYM